MTGKTLNTLMRDTVAAHAHKEFLTYVSIDDEVLHLTYRAFDELVQSAAYRLCEKGISCGSIVVVHMHNNVEFLICLFALARIGAIMVPMNRENVQSEASFIVQECTPELVIAESRVISLYEAIAREVSSCAFELVNADEFSPSVLSSVKQDFPDQEVTDTDTVEVIYTSGTTSYPKGVEFTHANLLYAGEYTRWQTALSSEDVFLTTMPTCHSNFQLAALMPVVVAGAQLVLIEKYSARKFWRQVKTYRATVIQLMSMIVKTLMMQPVSHDETCHSVREALYFLPLDTQTKEAFEERFGVRIMNSYGSTESLNWVITDFPTGKRRWPSVGRVGPGYEVKLVNKQACEVPCGEVGEIWIRGVAGRTLMKGYFRNEQATKKAFPEQGWLRTGDMARADSEGFIYFVDRKVNLIKRAGENISATEIEAVLMRHPDILEAAVIGRPDPVRDEMVVAFVVPQPGRTLSVEDVIAYCTEHLARFKVPSVVELRESLPHTCSMKVARSELK